MTAQQLINQLQALVKENPKAANKNIMLAQYDSESADRYGVESATGIEEKSNAVVIS